MSALRTFGLRTTLLRLVDAVNEAGPPAEPITDEELVTAVTDVLRRHGEAEPLELSPADAASLRHVLDQLHGALALRSADEVALLLNQFLLRHAAAPRLSAHDGTPWHLEVTRSHASWADWLAATSAFALAVLLSDRGAIAWGVCGASGCDRVYVDVGPGRRRRTCSSTCATRLRVARHRARAARS